MKPSGLADFHLHTKASFDCDTPLSAVCEAAIGRGLYAIAVTDHVEMTAFDEGHFALAAAESFMSASEAAQRYRGRLRVARGIELGEPLDDPAKTRQLLATHAYDFILGSLHNLSDGLDYYDYDFTGLSIPAVLQTYFEAILRMVQWGGFHALAHLGYPLRYIPPERRPADFSAFRPVLGDIFSTMANKGIALEINTSGLRGGLGSTLPGEELLRFYRACGGQRITFGSDAHTAVDVGADFAAASALARKTGFAELYAFFGGEPEKIPLLG